MWGFCLAMGSASLRFGGGFAGQGNAGGLGARRRAAQPVGAKTVSAGARGPRARRPQRRAGGASRLRGRAATTGSRAGAGVFYRGRTGQEGVGGAGVSVRPRVTGRAGFEARRSEMDSLKGLLVEGGAASKSISRSQGVAVRAAQSGALGKMPVARCRHRRGAARVGSRGSTSGVAQSSEWRGCKVGAAVQRAVDGGLVMCVRVQGHVGFRGIATKWGRPPAGALKSAFTAGGRGSCTARGLA